MLQESSRGGGDAQGLEDLAGTGHCCVQLRKLALLADHCFSNALLMCEDG